MKSKLIKVSILLLVVSACNGYSAKDKGSRKGGETPKDCQENSETKDKETPNSGTDPWGESYSLVASQVTFSDIKPTITQSCVSCHAGYDTYEIAKEKADTYIARMDLDESETGFMPKGGSKMSLESRSQLIAWKFAGFPDANGSVPSDSDTDNLNKIETDSDDEWSSADDADDC